ncbi:aldo/keto reductase [Phenylobacterium sp.]|uniref:aldo/keto reductase n=1 Tax=Phenylobacterium sp. TaxID=1871053 RepID=UPI00289D6817|nr:aldo/keto reductase [Phenylobacterium sp.]
MTSMPTRRLGRDGPEVSALGLGCMSYMQPGEEGGRAAVGTIQAALDAGFTLLDTADFYGSGVSEMNVGQAIRGRREQAFLSVKFGVQASPTRGIIGLDGRPNSVKNFAAYSLRRLGVDVIDLYQPARADPEVSYEETIGAVADLIQEGKVRYLGVSEVGADLLRRAHAVHPVTALEIEYSLACRFIEAEILPTARELGVGIVPYRILADGLLTGAAPQDTHFRVPRMQGENYARNRETAKALDEMAAAKGVTPAQLAIAWVLSRGDDIVPLIGVSRPSRIADNMAALAIALTAAERAELDRAFAPDAIVGARYPEAVLKWAAT